MFKILIIINKVLLIIVNYLCMCVAAVQSSYSHFFSQENNLKTLYIPLERTSKNTSHELNRLKHVFKLATGM